MLIDVDAFVTLRSPPFRANLEDSSGRSLRTQGSQRLPLYLCTNVAIEQLFLPYGLA